MQVFTLVFSELFIIECNNTQTKQLLVDKSAKFQIKFHHIDIYTHWLWQKVQQKTINICWVLTKKIVADGFIKALSARKQKCFMNITGIENKKIFWLLLKKKKTSKMLFSNVELKTAKHLDLVQIRFDVQQKCSIKSISKD